MVYLHDIAPLELWSQMVREGYVRVQTHPDTTIPYAIYDYSETCQFERKWNAVTLASRGLIVDKRNGKIISRVLTKFFNYGEPETQVDLNSENIVVSDKLDGSAGYSYPDTSGRLRIATRGSFASDQAIHASNVLKTRYEGLWEPVENRTYLWEIIYPQNRIVVSYDFDDLVLLAAIDNETGISIPASEVHEWVWMKTEEFPYATMTEALSAPPRDNAEGFVVHFRDEDMRVKIKQEDYIALHKIVTGLNKKRVWEVLSSGNDFTAWLIKFPDEFVAEIRSMEKTILAEYAALENRIEETYQATINNLPSGVSQKDFATYVMKNHKDLSAFLFSKRAGTNEKIKAKIWKTIEPEFEKPVWGFSDTKEVE